MCCYFSIFNTISDLRQLENVALLAVIRALSPSAASSLSASMSAADSQENCWTSCSSAAGSGTPSPVPTAPASPLKRGRVTPVKKR